MNKKEKVLNFIEENIKSGKYKPGTRIMSEPMLSEYLKISRYTVREALKDLYN
ncbi:MAG: GntR family transcriptional regulator, partial [Armatimonadetes bacterium]|nr:GntR family transcriptional regulator [Candidatus Hippobium faecium]